MTAVALYRIFDAEGGLLYIGQSSNPISRVCYHSQTKPKPEEMARIDVEWFADRAAAVSAEKAAIEAERPKWNFAHNSSRPHRSSNEFAEPALDVSGFMRTATPAQAALINELALNAPHHVTKERLFSALYGQDDEGSPDRKIIDVMICQSRRKLADGVAIHTVWGRGYRMELSPAHPAREGA